MSGSEITFADFEKIDVRVGTIVEVEAFPEARKPAFKLKIDFGPEIGVKKSSAQITVHYTRDQLLGRKVAAVVNFPPRQIGPFMSECLVTGFHNADGHVAGAPKDAFWKSGAGGFCLYVVPSLDLVIYKLGGKAF